VTKRLIIWKDVTSECEIHFGDVTKTNYVTHKIDEETGDPKFIGQFPHHPDKKYELGYFIQVVEEPDFREDLDV